MTGRIMGKTFLGSGLLNNKVMIRFKTSTQPERDQRSWYESQESIYLPFAFAIIIPLKGKN